MGPVALFWQPPTTTVCIPDVSPVKLLSPPPIKLHLADAVFNKPPTTIELVLVDWLLQPPPTKLHSPVAVLLVPPTTTELIPTILKQPPPIKLQHPVARFKIPAPIKL